MNIFELTESDVLHLAEVLTRADLRHRKVRIAFDGGVKIKVGEGMWSAPLGFKE